MRNIMKIFAVVAVLAIGLGVGQQEAQLEVELQAAIRMETVEGDLKGAIEAYEKLAEAGVRTIAAKALVRMGQCYEKLGSEEAIKAYERVVREYGDQKEIVAVAREKLDRILQATAVTKKEDEGLTIRKIPNPKGKSWVVAEAVSPDERYIAYRGG